MKAIKIYMSFSNLHVIFRLHNISLIRIHIPKGQDESGLIFPLNGGMYDCKFFAQVRDEFELKLPELN